MRIVVLGASRGIGSLVVEQGLQRKHTMTAFARNPQPIVETQARVVAGDVCDPAAVAAALDGQNAICWTVGIRPQRKPVTVFSEGTRVVLEAMKHAGVRRIVCVTGIGAGESKGHGGFLYDRLLMPLLLKSTYEDKDRQEQLLRASDMDWTIVRPGFLTNGPYRGDYRVLWDLTGAKAGRISRADVAHFILNELQNPGYVRRAVLVT